MADNLPTIEGVFPMNLRHSLLFLLAILVACSTSRLSDSAVLGAEEPDPRLFEFYDPQFRQHLNQSPLKMNGLYFRIVQSDFYGDVHQLLRFYPDGLVIQSNMYVSPDKAVQFPRQTNGQIHGYYGVEGDSLFFTTKAYYNHQPVFYSGISFGDSLILSEGSSSFTKKMSHTFYFFDENQ